MKRHLTDKPDRGRGTVSFAEMRRGGIGLCVATQIARYVHALQPAARLALRRAGLGADAGPARVVPRDGSTRRDCRSSRTRADLEAHLARWAGAVDQGPRRSATILSLEGADSIVTLEHLERAWEDGLRAVGPAHYGPGTYAQGTDATGGIGTRGRELLAEMERLGMILDATHLCDDSFWEALDVFDGPVWASHYNCRALVPHNRQFSDEQITRLVGRGAVIGAALDAWMIVPGWVRGKTTPAETGVTLDTVVDHIDHICQIAGNARHVGIGSDLDGAFGTEQTVTDLDSIADLAKIADLLRARGYGAADIDAIASGNYIRFLRSAWSERSSGRDVGWGPGRLMVVG